MLVGISAVNATITIDHLRRKGICKSTNVGKKVIRGVQKSSEKKFVLEVMVRNISHSHLNVQYAIDHAVDHPPVFAVSPVSKLMFWWQIRFGNGSYP
jgi:hypothetical protein